MRWVSVNVTKCFDGLLVPDEEIELEFRGRLFPGTHDTYYQPGDPPEFDIQKIFLVVNGKTTDKEVSIPDDVFEKAYDDLLQLALEKAEREEGPEYEPDEDRYEPDDYETDNWDYSREDYDE